MKRNSLITILSGIVVILFLMPACEKELTKVVKKEYPNGQAKFAIFYDGEPSQENMVKIELYYPNGQRQTLKNYKDGVQHGYSKAWYKDGSIMSEMKYINKLKQGDYVKYHQNGKPAYTGKYKNNRKQGKWLRLSESGDTISISYYEKGVLKKSPEPNKK